MAPVPSAAEVVDTSGVLEDLIHLAPMVIVAVWALLQLVADAFAGPGKRAFQRRLALVGVVLAAAAGLAQSGDWQYDAGVPVFSGFLVVDHFSILLDLSILAVVAAVLAFSGDYSRGHRFEYGEQETLVLIAAFGMMMLAHSADLLSLFLGIETMSISIYVLVGARWNSRQSSEAALKYFLMGAFASGLLLMGIALLYGALGTTKFTEMGPAITRVFTMWGGAQQPYLEIVMNPEGIPAGVVKQANDKIVTGMAPAALFLPGVFLVLSGFLFKVSAVPFHMWTPDAYDGAPTPVTAYMATGVKIGAVAAMLKLMVAVFSTQRLVTAPYGWTSAVALVAFLSMTLGNFAAVRQTNIKRLLAYSSIAHVGYILVGVVAAANFYGHAYGGSVFKAADRVVWSRATGDMAVAAVIYYVLTYAVATAGAFACVAWFGRNKREGIATHEWSGLAQRHPAMALGMAVCLVSLMGIPPAAGFFGKLFVFRAAFENDNLVLRFLVVAALLNSVVGAYYYLRIIVAMYFRPPPEREIEPLGGYGARVVVAAGAVASLALGVFADAAMRRAELAAAGFVYPAGTEARAEWVDRLRARWEAEEAEAALEDAAEAEGTPGEGGAAGQAESPAEGGGDEPQGDGGAKPDEGPGDQP